VNFLKRLDAKNLTLRTLRMPSGVLGGSQARHLVSSQDFKFLISHAKLTNVTCYLANVMKAISSLLPFLSISHYAAGLASYAAQGNIRASAWRSSNLGLCYKMLDA
jgi:hypothetical protein